MPELPTSNNSDDPQAPQKSRLSLRPKLNAPSDPLPDQSSQESESAAPSKPALKIGLKKPDFGNPWDSPISTPPAPTAPPSEPTEKPKKQPLKLKDSQSSPPSNEDAASSAPSTPPPLPPSVSEKPNPLPLSTADLPFTLPKEVKGPPPLFPLDPSGDHSTNSDHRTQKNALPETRPSITFDQLEPAHSKKAPPPVNAPVHKGKVTRGKQKYLLLLTALLISLGLFYQFYWLPQQSPQPPLYPSISETPPTPQPASPSSSTTSSDSTIATPATSSVITITPSAENSLPPEPPPDPLVASIVDNLAITLVKSSGSNPMIAINNIAYPIGSIVDENSQLTLIGFDLQRREIIFQAPNGSRYFRYY